MQKIRWDWLGPASLVIAIVLGGIQFMDWWSRPSERLTATARLSKVALPAPVKEYISKAYVQAAVSARDKNAAAKSNDQASQSNSATGAAEAPMYPLNIEPTYLDAHSTHRDHLVHAIVIRRSTGS
jgi:hypothetical protein